MGGIFDDLVIKVSAHSNGNLPMAVSASMVGFAATGDRIYLWALTTGFYGIERRGASAFRLFGVTGDVTLFPTLTEIIGIG